MTGFMKVGGLRNELMPEEYQKSVRERWGGGRASRGRGRPIGSAVAFLASLLLLLPSVLVSQAWEDFDYEDLEFRGVGIEGGQVWPARVEPTRLVGIRVDLGYAGPRVRISPHARYWSSQLRSEEVERLAEQIILVCERQVDAPCPETLDLGEVHLSNLELATDAHFVLLPARRLTPYVGGGLSVHLLNGRGDFIDGTFVEDLLDTLSPGLGAVAGLNVLLAESLQVGVEARFMLASDVRYGSVSAGGVWFLPTAGAVASGSFSWWRSR
jgi:hypothetical protein